VDGKGRFSGADLGAFLVWRGGGDWFYRRRRRIGSLVRSAGAGRAGMEAGADREKIAVTTDGSAANTLSGR